jgi:UDP-N-acetylmuramyl pentapeptide synthase
LSLEPGTATAIVEMGMRGLGQIADLARVAEPDVGLITNIHPVHLELLGTLENVARAKSELLSGLRPGGTAVVPAGCPVLDSVLGGTSVLRFGLGDSAQNADIRGDMKRLPGGETAVLCLTWPEGKAEVEVPFVSQVRMENAVAAAATCYAAGLPMDVCLSGLKRAQFTPSRGDTEQMGEWLIINDTYNSSPAAVQASIDELIRVAAECGGRPVAVLGDMLELGEQAAKFHEEAGAYAARKGVKVLWAVGPLSRSTMDGYRTAAPANHVGWVEQSTDAASIIETLRPGDVVLFKASRSMKLEVMLDVLRRFAADQSKDAGALAIPAAAHPGTQPCEREAG